MIVNPSNEASVLYGIVEHFKVFAVTTTGAVTGLGKNANLLFLLKFKNGIFVNSAIHNSPFHL